MKALVTGAAGFLGGNLVRELLAAGHEVRALHLPTDDLRNLAGLDVERVAGDVTDPASMRAATRGVGWVFHLAAIYALWLRVPARMLAANVAGTRNVLEAAHDAGVARCVVTSSIARFGGQGEGRRATEASAFALGETGDLYSATKHVAHELAVAAARDLDVVVVAPTGPIGEGDVGPTPTGRLLLACAGAPAMVVLRSTTNFAHARDIAKGHVLAAERGRRGETYLLGNRDLALRDLAAITLRVLGRRRPIVEVPFAVASVAARAAVAVAERTGKPPLITPAAIRIARLGLAADCAKARRELGAPQTPIEDAVRDALRWFAREGYLKDASARRALASLRRDSDERDLFAEVVEEVVEIAREAGRGGEDELPPALGEEETEPLARLEECADEDDVRRRDADRAGDEAFTEDRGRRISHDGHGKRSAPDAQASRGR